MRKEDLFKSFNEIDDDFLIEALEKKKQKDYRSLWKLVSASFVLALCIGVGLQAFNINGKFIKPGVEVDNPIQHDDKENTNSSLQPTFGGAATNFLFVDYIETDKMEIFDVVANGNVKYSKMLEKGLGTYRDVYKGKQVRYKVIVDLYADEKIVKDLPTVEKEVARLIAQGYISECESNTNENVTTNILIIEASYQELIDFKNNQEFGYLLLLYGQRYPNDKVTSSNNGFKN